MHFCVLWFLSYLGLRYLIGACYWVKTEHPLQILAKTIHASECGPTGTNDNERLSVAWRIGRLFSEHDRGPWLDFHDTCRLTDSPFSAFELTYWQVMWLFSACKQISCVDGFCCLVPSLRVPMFLYFPFSVFVALFSKSRNFENVATLASRNWENAATVYLMALGGKVAFLVSLGEPWSRLFRQGQSVV
jgi:hypothetical protein